MTSSPGWRCNISTPRLWRRGSSGHGRRRLEDRRDAAARAFGRFDRIRLGLQQADGVYAEALGGRLEAGQDAGRPGYSTNRAGLAAGVTHAFNPHYAVGLEAYFTSGRYESGGYRSDLVVGGFDAVSSYTRGPFFARLGAGFGVNRFGGLERATLGPLKNTSSATGLSANVTAETGLSYTFGALDVSPRLRLGWLGAGRHSMGDPAQPRVGAPGRAARPARTRSRHTRSSRPPWRRSGRGEGCATAGSCSCRPV